MRRFRLFLGQCSGKTKERRVGEEEDYQVIDNLGNDNKLKDNMPMKMQEEINKKNSLYCCMYYTSKIYNLISKKAKQTYFVNLCVFYCKKMRSCETFREDS